MKIGFVLDDSLDRPDGVQQYILTLGQWLQSQQHEVHYLVGETVRSDIPRIHSMSKNRKVRFNKNRLTIPLPANRDRIKKLLNSDRPFDVLHVQMPYNPFMAARVIKAAPKTTAVVGTFHILPFSNLQRFASRILGIWLRKTRKRFDAVASVSAPAAKFAKKSFKIKSVVIPNAVNSALFTNAKPFPKYDDGKINIVFLGRLVERKGCMELLQAVQQLHQKQPLMNVRVIICGRGPLENSLKTYVKHKRMSGLVQFTGFVSEKDKPRFLASAHIAAFPSKGGESFGIVLLEAMAAGAQVVIAGKNPGYRSVMPGHKEQFVKPSDIDAFAKTLKYFLIHGSARKKAQKWQKAHVAHYDIHQVGAQIEAMYAQAIAKRSR